MPPKSPLSAAEQRVLEEWVKRVPRFDVEGGEPPEMSIGVVWCPARVPLRWNPADVHA